MAYYEEKEQEELEAVTKLDYYLASILTEVRRSYVQWPGRVKVKDCILRFKRKDATLQEEHKKKTLKERMKEAQSWWGRRLGMKFGKDS